MRNLTITRRKRFVACLGKLQVYIEDPAAEELRINGVPCRKLGYLKNGETCTFPIGNDAAKVFVVGDKVSRNVINEFYPIPAGEEDVTLSGENKLNPGAGNPFCFDGITDEAVLANRKKRDRSGILVLIVACVVGFAAGKFGTSAVLNAASGNNRPQDFTSSGMTITLTESFRETSYEGYTACFESREAVVFALKEEFALIPGAEDYTVEEYGQLVILANNHDSTVQTENGLTWLEYSYRDGQTDTTYCYYAYMYKTQDAFWLVQFAVSEDLAEEYEPLFAQWAQTATFS